jgi:hypothetical protein
MAKHRSQRRRTPNSKSKTMRRAQRGGDLAGNPPSAWGWVGGTVGNGWTQFTNALTLQPGQNLGTIQSNDIVPVNNINAQDQQGMIGPYAKGDIPNQTGGKKHKKNKKQCKSKSKSKRGGNVLASAAVPAALIALNDFFGRGKKSKK